MHEDYFPSEIIIYRELSIFNTTRVVLHTMMAAIIVTTIHLIIMFVRLIPRYLVDRRPYFNTFREEDIL